MAWGWFAGGVADAQLATNSPFMPPQGAAAKAPTTDAPLEFGGWLEVGHERLYRVIDPSRKTSTWLKLNERDPTLDVVATQHDPDSGTLTVEHQGRTLTLPERKAKIVSAATVVQPLPAPGNVAPAVTQSVVLNPTPQDEQRRLEAVAAEVARRRALREQAAQQITPGQVAQRSLPVAAPQRKFQAAQPRDGSNQPRGLRRDGKGAQQQR